MSKKHRLRHEIAQSLRKWETDESASFTKNSVTNTGAVVPNSSSVQILSKHKPVSGNSPVDASGWRIPTSFRAYVCKLIPEPGFDYVCTNATVKRQYGSSGFPPSLDAYSIFLGTSGAGHFPRTSTNLKNRAITEALNKLKDGRINVAESLATLDQTISLIADVASSLYTLYKSLKGKNIGDQRHWDSVEQAYRHALLSHPGNATLAHKAWFFRSRGTTLTRPSSKFFQNKGQRWLEWHYGAQPLIQDVINGIALIRNGLPPPTICAVRHLEGFESLPPTRTGSSPYILSVLGEIKNGVHVRLDAEVTNDGLAKLDSLGLENPFSLGWELLPYSFVIDWLIPVGNAISALSATCGLQAKGQSVTTFTYTNVSVKWTDYPFVSGKPISYKIESLTTERVGLSTFSLPRLYIKSPFTSATRAATALALLSTIR